MELGKLTAVFDADTRKFDAGVRGVSAKVDAMTGTLRGLTGGVSSASGALTGLTSPMALAAGGAVVAATAIGGIVTGLFSLVKSTAAAGGELFDLAQKTNFAVETLSGLSIVAETTGSTIQGLSASLGIFQKNMEAASDANSKQGRLFRALNIDINDNEKALRQAFTALGKMDAGAQQTAIAMQLFGRSGKDVLAIVKETNGNLDAAIKKYSEMGLIISSSAASASDKFNDVLKETELQLSAVTRTIGMELLPTATRTLQDISRWLADNKAEWTSWGQAIVSVVSTVTTHIGYIINGLKEVMSLSPIEIRIIETVTRVTGGENAGESIKTGWAAGQLFQEVLKSALGRGTPKGPPVDFSTAIGGAAGRVPTGRTGTGGGGGGGGGSKQKDELEALKRVVVDLNNDFRKLDVELFNSANMTLLAAEKEKILAAVMGSLKDATKKTVSQFKDVDQALDFAISKLPKKSQAAAQGLRDEALAQFKVNEETRIAGDLTKQVEELSKNWRQEIENTRSGADQYTVAIQRLEKEYAKYGQTLSESTRLELEQAAAIQRTLAKMKELTRERIVGDRPRTFGNRYLKDAQDFGGGSFFMEGGTGTTRERTATAEVTAMRERVARIREQMMGLGQELTGIFSRSVGDGFEQGAKRGLATLALGLLDIVQNIFLKKLAEGLGNLLSNFAGAGAGGGGGFLSGLFKAILGGAVSGAAGSINLGGGSSFTPGGTGLVRPRIVGRADGGPVIAGLPYKVHRDEIILPAQNGMVFNKSQQGGAVNNYYINLPPSPKGSYNAPASQRELANKLVSALQGAQS